MCCSCASRMRLRSRSVGSCIRHGFTLVELLVVVAIIGTLVGLLLPAVQSAREAGRRLSCGNNLKQVGLGIVSYEVARKVYPSGRDARDPTGVSWAFRLLPYVEQSQIYTAFNKTARVDDDINSVAMRSPVATFYCPSRRAPAATHHKTAAATLEASSDPRPESSANHRSLSQSQHAPHRSFLVPTADTTRVSSGVHKL